MTDIKLKLLNKMFKFKKLVFICLLNLFLLSVDAQDVKDDAGTSYLPQIGDWAVGIDATPFFQYVGNLFNQNGNDYVPSITFTAQYPNSIFFKIKAGEYTTLRSILIIGMTHKEDNIINLQDEENPHQLINSALSVGGIVGVERTKSIKKRLLSYYGVQIGLQKKPFNNGTTIGKIEYIDKNDEELYFKEYGGTIIDFSLAPILGLEFYIFRHFALSGEVSLNFNRISQKKRYRIRGTEDPTVIDEKVVNLDLNPSTSGKLGVFLYF